jgi:hypothetical protein
MHALAHHISRISKSVCKVELRESLGNLVTHCGLSLASRTLRLEAGIKSAIDFFAIVPNFGKDGKPPR